MQQDDERKEENWVDVVYQLVDGHLLQEAHQGDGGGVHLHAMSRQGCLGQ
jgi:hypothetical protein